MIVQLMICISLGGETQVDAYSYRPFQIIFDLCVIRAKEICDVNFCLAYIGYTFELYSFQLLIKIVASDWSSTDKL